MSEIQQSDPSLRSRVFVLLQYVIPHHAVSRVVHWATRITLPAFKNALIRWFVKHFDVDLSEALHSSAESYQSFNAFFTRALKPGCRPVDEDAKVVVCPVDGSISQSGRILTHQIYQAKAHSFDLAQLLGARPSLAEKFTNGSFLTVYLAPYNYHRIHMPVEGRLQQMHYIPGRLFSVNATSVERIPGLFCVNERVVCVFDTVTGPMACILVGALNVGSIETVWAGEVAPARPRRARSWSYSGAKAPLLRKGEELGRFNMGSTVIVLFGEGQISLRNDLEPGAAVRMGETIGKASSQTDKTTENTEDTENRE